MKNLNCIYKNISKILFKITLIILISNSGYSKEIMINILGNEFTDEDVILSIIKDKPKNISKEYSNYLIKTLGKSNLFKNVSVTLLENGYEIKIIEYENLNNISFTDNDRLKDEELQNIASELNLVNLNPNSINTFIDQVQKIYQSFGYNNLKILTNENKYNNNTADIEFKFIEGKLTKIKKILFSGNNNIEANELKSIIKSKTKTLTNIFANNNYKSFILKNDVLTISNYYRNKGFKDVRINYKIEYLNNNKVNLYFIIAEGEQYYFSSIDIINDDKLLNDNQINELSKLIKLNNSGKEIFSFQKIEEIKDIISNKIIEKGIEFFEIQPLEKISGTNIDIAFNIKSLKPKYAKQINIYGNYRTFEYVIRRELELSEGDPINSIQIEKIEKKLKSLGLFNSVSVKQRNIEDNLFDVDITVEEKQTGTVNAGLSVGTIDGFAVIAGLSERNFSGTGRSVKTLLNTSTNKNQFIFEVKDRLLYENNVDTKYAINYSEDDFASRSSYKLNTSSLTYGVSYDINPKLRHGIDLSYIIKDYTVTDSSTVSSVIDQSAGESVSFLLGNNILYSSLNSQILPKNGNYLLFNNLIESPSSSSNGFIKNILTLKKYKKFNKNIISNQTKIGNIISLGDNDILSDDKFSIGGRWLRGFDVSGAGPRNSRTSYVGGNNLFVTKFDISRELYENSDFPIYLNIFNDYGIVWENKTNPTNHDTNLRGSIGFGLRYYSPIGPIGLSWGFPIMDESYDIKRMFLFSVGNID